MKPSNGAKFFYRNKKLVEHKDGYCLAVYTLNKFKCYNCFLPM